MSFNVANRRVHHWIAAVIAVPFGLMLVTGLLLQIKKQWTFVQPPEQRAQVDAPALSLPMVLERLRAIPELGVGGWDDIARIDVRPDKGIAKVILKSNWEAQVHLGTGEVLQTAYRRSDVIETLHDGSFFAGDVTKLGLFLPVAFGLTVLWLTGLWMWWVPFAARRRRERSRGATAATSRLMLLCAVGGAACGSAPQSAVPPAAVAVSEPQNAAPIPLVGHWVFGVEDGQAVATADATGWNGEPRPDAGQAGRTLFGVLDPGFLANTGAPGAFPIAVWAAATPLVSGTASVEFKLIGGESDQIAGLLFGLAPDGEYYYARYNTKDDDVALWRYADGERTNLAHGEGRRRLPLGEWHRLSVTVTGRRVAVVAAGDLRLEYDLPTDVSGPVGVWTKRDSITAFRNLRID